MKNLYLIVGPSGCGKTTLANNLHKMHGMRPVVSYTTRAMREGEVNGVDHWFISEEEFDQLGKLVAYTKFNGYRYGVTQDILDKSDVYVIDPAGVEYLKKNMDGDRKVVVIGILTNLLTCIGRMQGRGDNNLMIQERISNDEKAFKNFSAACDFMVDGRLSPLGVMDQAWASMLCYEDPEEVVTYETAIYALNNYISMDAEASERWYVRDMAEACSLTDAQLESIGLGWINEPDSEEE